MQAGRAGLKSPDGGNDASLHASGCGSAADCSSRQIGKNLAVTETLFENVGLFGSLPSWMFSKEKAGGGVGLTSGIHLLDHVAWITGRPLSLQAARFGHSQALGDIEDTAAFFLTSDTEYRFTSHSAGALRGRVWREAFAAMAPRGRYG